MLKRPNPSPTELRVTTVVGKRHAGVFDRLATLTNIGGVHIVNFTNQFHYMQFVWFGGWVRGH